MSFGNSAAAERGCTEPIGSDGDSGGPNIPRRGGASLRAAGGVFSGAMRFEHTLVVLGLAALSACAPKPPVHWEQGGAPLILPNARWDRGSDDPIEIRSDGKVMEDGDLLMVVDRAGRIVDDDYEPIALLLPDGHVAGNDNELLGRVGHANAAPPGSAAAWIAILPNGQALFFDEEGEREAAGVWTGCEGPQKRTCTYVMHTILVRHYLSRRRSGVGVGVGIMMTP